MSYSLAEKEQNIVNSYIAAALTTPDTAVATDSQLVLWSSEAGLSENASAALLNAATLVRNEPELHKLFRALHYGFFHTSEQIAEPDLETALGMKSARAFYLLLGLSGLNDLHQLYLKLNYSESMRSDISSDWGIWARHHFNNNNIQGLTWGILSWLRAHVRGEVLQFGRLQCNLALGFPGKLKVYRNLKNNSVVAVSDPGQQCNGAGYLADKDEKVVFTTILEQNGRILTGHRINPRGFIQPQTEQFDLTEYCLELQDNDPVINLHIPESGPLSLSSCAKSVEAMREFFLAKYPEYKFKAFVCFSWLLDGQLHNVLPPESNIIKFQNAGYVFPFTASSDAVFRVFGTKAAQNGYKSVPHTSSMQRRLANYLDLGNRFRQGGIFLLNADLPWGTNPYISQPE